MSWTDQNPQATDVLLAGHITTGKTGRRVHFEIDRFETFGGSVYRATVGNLFGSEEVVRHRNLCHVLRHFNMKVEKA